MAQDFWQAFHLGGTDSLGINSISIDGVNMAAIQALEKRTAKLNEMTAELNEKTAELQQKTDEIALLKEKVATFENAQAQYAAQAAEVRQLRNDLTALKISSRSNPLSEMVTMHRSIRASETRPVMKTLSIFFACALIAASSALAQRGNIIIPTGADIAVPAGAQLCADRYYANNPGYGTLSYGNDPARICGAVIPVEFLSLSAYHINGSVTVLWRTVSETKRMWTDMDASQQLSHIPQVAARRA